MLFKRKELAACSPLTYKVELLLYKLSTHLKKAARDQSKHQHIISFRLSIFNEVVNQKASKKKNGLYIYIYILEHLPLPPFQKKKKRGELKFSLPKRKKHSVMILGYVKGKGKTVFCVHWWKKCKKNGFKLIKEDVR